MTRGIAPPAALAQPGGAREVVAIDLEVGLPTSRCDRDKKSRGRRAKQVAFSFSNERNFKPSTRLILFRISRKIRQHSMIFYESRVICFTEGCPGNCAVTAAGQDEGRLAVEGGHVVPLAVRHLPAYA